MAPMIDVSEAQRFLTMLAGADQPVTFQTFDDGKPQRGGRAVHLHGPFAPHAAKLIELNGKGAGVFVMVNEGDGLGRKTENVTAVRAVFLDLDGAPLEPVIAAATAAGLLPHAFVESSPGKWHIYWRVQCCALDQFKDVQRALAAKFGGDVLVCDLPRVMRLPGFVHSKGEPVQTRIDSLRENAPPFDLAAIVAGFDLAPPAAGAAHATPQPATPAAPLTEARIGELRALLAAIPATSSADLPSADDYGPWLTVGLALYNETGGSIVGLDLWDEWSERSDKYAAGACAEKWTTMVSYSGRRVAVGTLAMMAKRHGANVGAIARDAAALADPEGDDATFKRLATLSPADYDRQRKSEAKRLGLSVGALDVSVQAARPAATLPDAGSGSALVFEPVEPWPEPVDGGALLTEMAAVFDRYCKLPPNAASVLAA